MNDISYMTLCVDFFKAYFSNPHSNNLLVILVLAVGVSSRFEIETLNNIMR